RGGIEAIERRIALRGAGARPDRVAEGRRSALGGGARSMPRLTLDPLADAIHEDCELADVLRSIGQALPGSIFRRMCSGERGDRNPADAAREQKIERVLRRSDDRPLT